MNEGELRIEARSSSEARPETETSAEARGPLKAVTLLMPVWGYRFVNQFLEFCLPTLLSPGNIPAVAAALPCRFVVLSTEIDEPVIRSHPAWIALERFCATEIRLIDDLITDSNHTATITLAFARAVRESNEMLDTCFLFLVSDYLVADGSLRAVLARIQAGASGVVAGNYQIVAEDAIPLLRRRADLGSPSIVLSPRELMRWSLAHLHPATAANIVNFGLSHNAHVNRLFWRVDDNTLIGRFYLMHMIGIRPEVTDFVIGASCDYSFVPEMCPSGNVTVLTDSDEYFVVEMQPRHHESKHLLPGPIEVPQLAESLSEWTTADHRRNVENTIVYHADEIPETLPRFVAEADAFVASVRAQLVPEPHPHRNHHYWIGSIAVNRARSHRPLSKKDWEFLLGEALPTKGLAGRLWALRTKVLGSLPDVTRLHPRWPDYGLPLRALKQLSSNGRLLLLAPQPASYARWVARAANEIETLECSKLIELRRDHYFPLVGNFDACLMVLTEDKLDEFDELIARVGPLLKPGGQIMIMVTNDRPLDHADEFGKNFASQSARLFNSSAWLAEVHYVPATRMRWKIHQAMNRLALREGIAGWRSPALLPRLALVGGSLALATYVCNLGIRAKKAPPLGVWSSVFLILRRAEGSQPPLPVFKLDQVGPLSLPPYSAEAGRIGSQGVNGSASHEVDADIWRDDPDRLATKLARYRFVVGVLKSRHDVAQYGADWLGVRLVLPKIKKIAIYDADPFRIAEITRRYTEEMPIEARAHDIMIGTFPKAHDSIYSLETLQYVSRSDEDKYVRNMRDSLARDYDVLILGTPSIAEFETEGRRAQSLSAATSIGFGSLQPAHPIANPEYRNTTKADPVIYTRTGEELKALLTMHFHDVFIFSMIGEIVRPGAHTHADYVFAICCTKKH